MLISKWALVWLAGFSMLSAQVREFAAGDSVSVNDVLKSDLQFRHDLGSAWNLSGINTDSIKARYEFSKQYLLPDSVIVTGSGLVSPSITRRFFQPLTMQPLTYGTDRSFQEIRDSYAFINQKSGVSYARIGEKPVAIVDFNPDFASEISGVAGGQRTANNRWILTGQIQVHFENAWRSAGAVDFQWERLEEESQKIMIGIDEPFPFGFPIGGGGSYGQEIRSGLFTQTRRELYLSGSSGLGGRWQAGSSMIQNRPTFDGRAAGLTALRERLIKLKLTQNSLDDRWLPERGVRQETQLEFGSENGSVGDRALVKFHFSGEHYRSWNQSWVWKTRLLADGIFTETVSDYQRLRSGGIQTIRGYPEQLFSADRQFIISVEGQPVINPSLRGVLFIDAGWLAPRVSPGPFSWGVGFIQNSKSAMIKFYYGIGRDISLSDGQIHFQIINKF